MIKLPYKDPKEQADFMRKYRTPYMRGYRKKRKESSWRKERLMEYFVAVSKREADLKNEMVSFISQVIKLVGQPGLSDDERIRQIKDLPVSWDLALLVTPEKSDE